MSRAGGLLVAMIALAGAVEPAQAGARAGTAMSFSGVDDPKRQEDVHNVIHPKGSRALKGSSCCGYFVVSFPTDETFRLRSDSCEIASGTVQERGSQLLLVPDAASWEVLRWWAENEVESFWNAGVFSLDLHLRWSRLKKGALVITGLPAARGAGRGTRLKVALALQGAVRAVDRTRIRGRFAPGPANGSLTVAAKYSSTFAIDDLEEACTYPPEVPCTAENEEYFATGEPRPTAWPGADYCFDP